MTTVSSQATVTASDPGFTVYNQIMGGIDSELLIDKIPHLAEKYKDETKEDRVKRIERYNKAFAAFDIAASDFMKSISAQKNVQRKRAMASAEIEARAQEMEQLQQIESHFS